MIQTGGVYTTFCHREGIHLQKHAIEMRGVSRYFFTCIGVRGRLDPPDKPEPKIFGLDVFLWGGGLPREGVGAK